MGEERILEEERALIENKESPDKISGYSDVTFISHHTRVENANNLQQLILELNNIF